MLLYLLLQVFCPGPCWLLCLFSSVSDFYPPDARSTPTLSCDHKMSLGIVKCTMRGFKTTVLWWTLKHHTALDHPRIVWRGLLTHHVLVGSSVTTGCFSYVCLPAVTHSPLIVLRWTTVHFHRFFHRGIITQQTLLTRQCITTQKQVLDFSNSQKDSWYFHQLISSNLLCYSVSFLCQFSVCTSKSSHFLSPCWYTKDSLS